MMEIPGILKQNFNEYKSLSILTNKDTYILDTDKSIADSQRKFNAFLNINILKGEKRYSG